MSAAEELLLIADLISCNTSYFSFYLMDFCESGTRLFVIYKGFYQRLHAK